jgi:hypothetical protein
MTLSHVYLTIDQYVSRSKLLDKFLVKVLQIELKKFVQILCSETRSQTKRQTDRQTGREIGRRELHTIGYFTL